MILSQSQLAKALGFKPNQMAKIEKCLRRQGIKVFYGKNCIWTTTELIAQAKQLEVLSDSQIIKIDDTNG